MDSPATVSPQGTQPSRSGGAVEADPSRPLVLVGPLPPPHTGQSVAFEMLVEAAGARGIDHSTIDLSRSGESRDVTAWASPTNRIRDYLFIFRDYVRRLGRGRKVVYITIAQSLRGFLRDMPLIWAARLAGHSVVAHMHGGNYGAFYASQPVGTKALIRSTLRRCHAIVVLGEPLISMFDFSPELRSRIRVVPNGLPFHLAPGRRAPKTPPRRVDEPLRILYLSNLVESKGYLDLLEALRILVHEHGLGNVKCDFCGLFMTNPDDRRVRSARQAQELFEATVSEFGLKDNVRYRGVVAGAEKVRLLEQAHFFALPTNYDKEGQPISIIEAMAYGSIVVSTPYRAIPEMVLDGVTGWLVPFGNPRGIAEAIRDTVRDPAAFGRMSQAAMDRYQARFTGEEHVRQLFAVLDDPEGRNEPIGSARSGRSISGV